ncbi:glycerophosphodiester phosphodiesterase family protein [Fulvimarina sp. 2208YS6-2-32]|uniref:Glycerophosphodiester phosphodiesterase family protein n=1 Tax=Fulvimarina uroteuthidis TaxID=3098149 RepID=A0ABU5I2Z4_9HYPH|nr:glycerophosphodiester phosphodiesterase family protein [Fulvimarina sp. 2208YS6-2-32]MDY8109724.1 glycerophosphodiester phosphodiesterase family protein [Fulvimarina sp. 2208YS6-2-32]
MANAPAWLTAKPFAHRGLHDGNDQVPENSLAAARLAIAGGYGIECDLQLSSDGVPFVFHDDELARLTGAGGDVRALDAAAIGALRLIGGEPVPTLAEFLRLVGGRVPLLIELKGRSAAADATFAAAVARDLEGYEGAAALMSFAPHLVTACRNTFGKRPVGLTAEGQSDDELAEHRRLAAASLDFVSYDHRHLPNALTRSLRQDGIPVLSWTIRSAEEAHRALAYCDQITFEGFTPSRAG